MFKSDKFKTSEEDERMVEDHGQGLLSLGHRARGFFAPDLFQGQVVLVTGGSRGIGRAVAVAFGALGAKVIINFHSRQDEAGITAEAIAALGGTALCTGFDVTDFHQTRAAIARIAENTGPVDILINCAGTGARENRFALAAGGLWAETESVNLRGAIHCSRALSAGFVARRRGKIINVATRSAAVLGLTSSLASEFAPHNVQVNTLIPGNLGTETAADVAWTALFLASRFSTCITGESIGLGKGWGGRRLNQDLADAH